MRFRVTLAAALSALTLLVSSPRARAADEYSFSWLDPEKKIYVLQNRKFLKSFRPLVSLMGGAGLSNPYRTVLNVDGRLAFYVSEAWGLELFYAKGFNSSNGTLTAVEGSFPGVHPIVREIQSRAGAMVQWVPWYAKINAFNAILHFDWYVAAGAGMVDLSVNGSGSAATAFSTQNVLSFFASTGHHYHVNRWLAVRVDLTGTYYPSQLFGNSGTTDYYSNYDVSAGVVFKLL